MKLLDFKKGQGTGNVIAGIVLIFSFAITILFVYLIVSGIITEMDSAGMLNTDAMTETADKFLNALAIFDYVTVLLMVLVIISIGVTSYRVASAPIFFVITFISAGFIGFISYFFNSIFGQIVTDATFTATVLFFPRTLLVATNLHWVALAMIVLGAIALYGKAEKGQFLS